MEQQKQQKQQKITPEHDQVRHLKVVSHYEAHPEQKEERRSFEETKKRIHKENRKCFIDNEMCDHEHPLEVHHEIIELSMATGIDWGKVNHDFPLVTDANDYDQMQVLCRIHHREPYTGVHYVPYNEWIAQKYLTKEALEHFKNRIEIEKKKDREGSK